MPKMVPAKNEHCPKHQRLNELKQQNRPFNSAGQRETINGNRTPHQHQHYFSHFKPIRLINVYHGSNSFSTAIKVKGLMSLVKCEGCSMQFISTTIDQNDANIQRQGNDNAAKMVQESVGRRKRRGSVEETLAAYYNTSQLVSN